MKRWARIPVIDAAAAPLDAGPPLGGRTNARRARRWRRPAPAAALSRSLRGDRSPGEAVHAAHQRREVAALLTGDEVARRGGEAEHEPEVADVRGVQEDARREVHDEAEDQARAGVAQVGADPLPALPRLREVLQANDDHAE